MGGPDGELLAPRSRSYVGIDYTPEMIDLSHRLLPELRFEVMDARNLAAFEDASFDLVVFSYNGIDSVEGEGRLQVLNEVARVLRPGSCFVFSTFNRGWNGFGTSRFSPRVTWTADPVRLAYRLTMRSMGWFRQHWYRRYEIQGEHNVILHHAHHFGIMVYATTPAQLRRQLTDAGFEARFDLFSPQGKCWISVARLATWSISTSSPCGVTIRRARSGTRRLRESSTCCRCRSYLTALTEA